MFEGIYEWLKDLAYYVILVTALSHMIPGEVYQKYIRFFTGLVMVILLLSPILSFFQEENPLERMERYEQGMEDLERWKAVQREVGELSEQNWESAEGAEVGQKPISIRKIPGDAIEVEEIKIEEEGTETME